MATHATDTQFATIEGGLPERSDYRSPPHNTEIEAALIGAILTNNRGLEKVSELLRPEHFYEPVLGRIYDAASKLIEQGQVASPPTLKHYFERDPALTDVGGAEFLYDLAANAVMIVNAEELGRSIYDLYLKRELIAVGEDIVNEAYEPNIDIKASDQLEAAEQRLYDLAATGQTERSYYEIADAAKLALQAAEEAYKRETHIVGVTTGFRELDTMLGGLHRSDLLILAGRPSMGKTALATNIAFNAAKAFREIVDEYGRTTVEGGHVLFFSLEMSAEQLAGRILAEQSEVPSDKIRRGDISADEFERLAAASQELFRLPLYIDDTPALSVSALRTRARRLKSQKKLHMIVIDYLQLMQVSPGSRPDNRVQEVAEITRGLKTLAKDLDVPVVALSQLSRQVEQRDNKRPQLADLRESGTIEQDSDVVMFIFREEYYLQRDQPSRRDNEAEEKFHDRVGMHNTLLKESRNIAEVIIAKQRHGPVGTVELQFNGDLTKFSDLDSYHKDPDADF
ncbi:MAG: Replicative DNA helicase [Alphaproteobacteria bacterium MarineAlpha4_Bin2]|nr:MAG: Replicative DNA helicase [Alphaproteobacteria bacterium MarineAlpha4_Bin2]